MRLKSAFLPGELYLRTALHDKEKELVVVRAAKRQHTDNLINVMADYEKRKTEALNGIAQLVGEDPVDDVAPSLPKKKTSFAGF